MTVRFSFSFTNPPQILPTYQSGLLLFSNPLYVFIAAIESLLQRLPPSCDPGRQEKRHCAAVRIAAFIKRSLPGLSVQFYIPAVKASVIEAVFPHIAERAPGTVRRCRNTPSTRVPEGSPASPCHRDTGPSDPPFLPGTTILKNRRRRIYHSLPTGYRWCRYCLRCLP